VQSDRFLKPFAGFQKVKQAVEKVRPDFLDSLKRPLNLFSGLFVKDY